MGFGSQARLNVHLQYHEKRGNRPVAHPTDIDHNQDDVELIILDAVKANDLDLVRDFIADVPRFSETLLSQAVVSSSSEMLEVLLEACKSDQDIESTVLIQAVGADNLEASRMLLNRGVSVDSEVYGFCCMNYAFKNRSPEMIKLLLPYEPTPTSFKSFLRFFIPLNTTRLEDAKAIQCLSLLQDCMTENDFDECFILNAERGCSIAIAEFLLQNGVKIDRLDSAGHTALYFASFKKTRTAAELMKFLLESGADPHVEIKGRPRIAQKPGPRNISKWFGISWEQLVEESRKKHAASSGMKS